MDECGHFDRPGCPGGRRRGKGVKDGAQGTAAYSRGGSNSRLPACKAGALIGWRARRPSSGPRRASVRPENQLSYESCILRALPCQTNTPKPCIPYVGRLPPQPITLLSSTQPFVSPIYQTQRNYSISPISITVNTLSIPQESKT